MLNMIIFCWNFFGFLFGQKVKASAHFTRTHLILRIRETSRRAQISDNLEHAIAYERTNVDEGEARIFRVHFAANARTLSLVTDALTVASAHPKLMRRNETKGRCRRHGRQDKGQRRNFGRAFFSTAALTLLSDSTTYICFRAAFFFFVSREMELDTWFRKQIDFQFVSFGQFDKRKEIHFLSFSLFRRPMIFCFLIFDASLLVFCFVWFN